MVKNKETITLADRMKNYEKEWRLHLDKDVPMIIRVDGKNFSKFTKGFQKPFDVLFHECMFRTAKCLCENIEGAVVAYSQSDEISILVFDSFRDSSSWYGKQVQKITSVSASFATLAFNKALFELTHEKSFVDSFYEETIDTSYFDFSKKYFCATFDSRVFNVPNYDVNNVFVWRQQDAIRNAISMVGHNFYSTHQLQNVSSKELVKKLISDKKVNFYRDYAEYLQRGFCIVKKKIFTSNPIDKDIFVKRSKWILDFEIPLFKEDKQYIGHYIESNNNKKKKG